jgi:hypothetical protein
MPANPSEYLPCDYKKKKKICSNPDDPKDCIFLVDGKYYYIKVRVNVGGWVWCSLVYVAGVTQTS